MGDENKLATGGILCAVGGDGEWHTIGQLSDTPMLTAGKCDTPTWDVTVPHLSDFNFSETITLTIPWWFDWARVARLIMGDQYPACHLRPRWTIRTLRRGGKSHRGKHA